MNLLALIIALLLEQYRPLSSREKLHGWLSAYVEFFQHNFNAGQSRHGRIAWLVAVLPLLAVTMAGYGLLFRIHPFLAWAFNVAALYLTMGFRQFSHYFTDIHTALRSGNLDGAKALLSRWCGERCDELNEKEVIRVTIEQALMASQRHVFGVIVWFVLFGVAGLGGATGAVLYRMGQFLRAHWSTQGVGQTVATEAFADAAVADEQQDRVEAARFGGFADWAFHILEWLPVRLTAMTFAIVGNFEDTLHCWQTQAADWQDRNAGILLASGAGALGIQLGMPIPRDGALVDRPVLGVNDASEHDPLQSAVGLVWRSVVFWMIMLALLSLASLYG